MGRLNPEQRTPYVPQDRTGSTIGPLSIGTSQVGSFVDLLRQATMVVDQAATLPETIETNHHAASRSNGDDDDHDRKREDLYPSSSTADDRRSRSERTDDRKSTARDESREADDAASDRDRTDRADAVADDRKAQRDDRDQRDRKDESSDDASVAKGENNAKQADEDAQDAAEDLVAIEQGMKATLADLAAQEHSKSKGGNGNQVAAVDQTVNVDADALLQQEVDGDAAAGDRVASTDASTGEDAQSHARKQDVGKTLNMRQSDVALDADADAAADQASGDRSSGDQKRTIAKPVDAPTADTSLLDEVVAAAKSGDADSDASNADGRGAGHAAAATAEVKSESGPTNSNSNGRADGVGQAQANASKQAAARRAANGAQADQTGQVDRAKLVQRVSRAFQSIANQGGTVRMKLHPEELGQLTIRVSVERGAMTAHVETETAAAKQLLTENLGVLREKLAEQNIKIDRFEVELAGHMGDGLMDQPQDQGAQDHQQRRSTRSLGADDLRIDSPSDDEFHRPRADGQGLIDMIG